MIAVDDLVAQVLAQAPAWRREAGALAARANGDGAVPADLAGLIDHTLLRPDATRAEIEAACAEARQHRFASVCVNGHWVATCKALLAGSPVRVCAVVGFPLGAMATAAKAFEARTAVEQGAAEIDMVVNLGALRSRDHQAVLDDLAAVVAAAASAAVKVILETGALEADEKVIACALAEAAGAAFVKTSTGFGKGGATVEDVALMRAIVGDRLGVKASGGVRTADDARRMIRAGASRLGASASVAIVGGGRASTSGQGY